MTPTKESEKAKRSHILDEHAEYEAALTAIADLLVAFSDAWLVASDRKKIMDKMQAAIPSSISGRL